VLADSATAAVAVASAVALGIVFAAAVASLAATVRSLRALRRVTEEFRRESRVIVGGMHDSAARAEAELDRLDTLLDAAESVSATVDEAARLAHRTVSSPVIKLAAIGAGTTRAAKRLRVRAQRQ
jgi:hypothetical protein